jgi:hypothetical protein
MTKLVTGGQTMPAATRRAAGAVVAAIGIVMVLVGAWVTASLGPSGEASFSAVSKTPGPIVIPADVLNAVDLPVRITATRPGGGPLLVLVGPSNDARAVLTTSAVSTVTRMHYAAKSFDLSKSGSGAPADIGTADVWRLVAKGAGSAALVVEQGRDTGTISDNDPGRSPETAVVTSGDATALNNVKVTLTWANQSWFFKALALATAGAVLAAFALNDLWQGRDIGLKPDVVSTPTAEVPA